MKVQCNHCSTILKIDHSKFTTSQLLIACPNCQAKMRVQPSAIQKDLLSENISNDKPQLLLLPEQESFIDKFLSSKFSKSRFHIFLLAGASLLFLIISFYTHKEDSAGTIFFMLGLNFILALPLTVAIAFVFSYIYRLSKSKQGISFKPIYFFSTVLVILITLIPRSPNSPSKQSTSTYSEKTYVCPHCKGSGERINMLTYKLGQCASCAGTGRINQFQHDHYSNDNENNENLFTCPRCGGTGNQTNMDGSGMSQSTCILCQGSGKVNQRIYEHFDN